MDLKKRYKWAREENGRYTVYDVEIFSPISREYVTPDGEKAKLSITAKTLKLAEETFRKDRIIGHYPRAHEGHQDVFTAANAPGIGYLDNVRVEGNTLFSDIVEISPEKFQKIYNGDLPYRSVEFNAAEGRIGSLALLESRKPALLFPILILEEKPVEPAKMGRYRVQLFQDRQKTLFLGGKAMPTDPTAVVAPVPEKDKKKLEPEQLGDKYQEDGDGEVEESKEHASAEMALLKEILAEIKGLAGSLKGQDAETEDLPEEKPDVAMQDAGTEKEIFSEIKKMRQFQAAQARKLDERISRIEGASVAQQYDARLKILCEDNPSLDYNAHREILSQFADVSAKENFLGYLESQAFQAPTSSVADGLLRAVSNPAQLDQYADKPQHIQRIAQRARKDYRETINQANPREAQKFQAMHPDEAAFVAEIVAMEEEIPGHYESEIVKK